ncbi:MAG: DUF4124 domain-containing protein [Gammaproteobacteria bacterium]|nr:DUF4124 domain-containing protein [Gammaproteobacteria bacterium]
MTATYITQCKIKALLLSGLLFFVVYTCASAATLYKWVDENGNIRYSDRLPPSQIMRKRETLNEHGVVIDTREAAQTVEERKAQKEARRVLEVKLAEEKRQEAARKKHDRVLLLTFSSEEEMISVRDNRIEVIDSVIRLIESSIASTEKRLLKLEDNADSLYLSKGKVVPGGLAQNIEHFTRKVTNRNEQLRLKELEKNKIENQFDADLKRFRWLKSGASE